MNRNSFLALFTLSAIAAIFFLPPIHQNPHYHQFSNHLEHLGIQNFWNVLSNLAFLVVAATAWPRLKSPELTEPGSRRCFRILLIGIAATTFGSAYYHWQPSDSRLVWDRLPMTIVFVCILTLTIGERVNTRLAQSLLAPLLVFGVVTVFYWKWTGDLRPYALIQFYPIVALPLMLLLFPSGSTSVPAQWGMILCYALAKCAEMLDGRLNTAIPGGAHAWKHVLAALGLFIYTQALSLSKTQTSKKWGLAQQADDTETHPHARVSRVACPLLLRCSTPQYPQSEKCSSVRRGLTST